MHCECSDYDCPCLGGKCRCMDCCCYCLSCFCIRMRSKVELDVPQNDYSTAHDSSSETKSSESISSDESVSALNRTGTTNGENTQLNRDSSSSSMNSTQVNSRKKFNYDSGCLLEEFEFLFNFIAVTFPGKDFNISESDMIGLKMNAFKDIQSRDDPYMIGLEPFEIKELIIKYFTFDHDKFLSLSSSCEIRPKSSRGEIGQKDYTFHSQKQFKIPVFPASSEKDASGFENPRNSSNSTSGNSGIDSDTENKHSSQATAEDEPLLMENVLKCFLSGPLVVKTPVEIADSLQVSENASLTDQPINMNEDIVTNVEYELNEIEERFVNQLSLSSL